MYSSETFSIMIYVFDKKTSHALTNNLTATHNSIFKDYKPLYKLLRGW